MTDYYLRMGGSAILRLLLSVLSMGISVHWVPFSSPTFPYTISQPSSFRHYLYTNTAHEKIDYFSPSLGSATTDVAIGSVTGTTVPDPKTYLRNQRGFNLRQSGSVTVAGRSRPLTAADFSSYGLQWTEEQVSFVSNGNIWRLSISYDHRYRNLRPTMLKMVRSFQFRSGQKH
jgi:hypothetical protein